MIATVHYRYHIVLALIPQFHHRLSHICHRPRKYTSFHVSQHYISQQDFCIKILRQGCNYTKLNPHTWCKQCTGSVDVTCNGWVKPAVTSRPLQGGQELGAPCLCSPRGQPQLPQPLGQHWENRLQYQPYGSAGTGIFMPAVAL